eukprot:1288179-Prymnesium_polylepis.1
MGMCVCVEVCFLARDKSVRHEGGPRPRRGPWVALQQCGRHTVRNPDVQWGMWCVRVAHAAEGAKETRKDTDGRM